MGYEKCLGMGYVKFTRMGYDKFLGMGYKKFLGMGYKKFLGMGYEIGYKKFLRIGSYIFLGIITRKSPASAKPLPLYSVHSRNFSMKNLSPENLEKISNYCRHFHWIFL